MILLKLLNHLVRQKLKLENISIENKTSKTENNSVLQITLKTFPLSNWILKNRSS